MYVTFDREEDKRECLKAMSVGQVCAFFDCKDRCKPDKWGDLTFYGNVLQVKQAPEPEDIQWTNLSVSPLWVYCMYCVVNVVCLLIVWMMAWDIAELETAGRAVLASILISVYNSLLPTIMQVVSRSSRVCLLPACFTRPFLLPYLTRPAVAFSCPVSPAVPLQFFNKFEPHATLTDQESSLLGKMVASRCFISVGVLYLVNLDPKYVGGQVEEGG